MVEVPCPAFFFCEDARGYGLVPLIPGYGGKTSGDASPDARSRSDEGESHVADSAIAAAPG